MNIIIILIIILFIIFQFKKLNTARLTTDQPDGIYRFIKPTCPYCKKSEVAWNKFIHNIPVVNYRLINLSNTSNTKNTELFLKLQGTTVPYDIIVANGVIHEHKGDRTVANYTKWANKYLSQINK